MSNRKSTTIFLTAATLATLSVLLTVFMMSTASAIIAPMPIKHSQNDQGQNNNDQGQNNNDQGLPIVIRPPL